MEEIQLDVQIRNALGTHKISGLREQGLIPGIIYGGDQKPTAIQLDGRNYKKIMRQHRGEMVLFHLNVMEGEKKLRDYAVVIKEEQVHPVSDEVIHIDFNRINLKKEIQVNVPILLKGEAAGVKQKGILQQFIFELDVICLPNNIPAHVDIDVSALNVGDILHLSDVKLPENVKTRHDPSAMICMVVAQRGEEEPVAEAGPVEPEVTKEKKKEAPAAEAKAGDKDKK